MTELLKKTGLIAVIALSQFALAACSDNDAEDAIEEAGDAMEDAADNVGDAVDDTADAVKDATN